MAAASRKEDQAEREQAKAEQAEREQEQHERAERAERAEREQARTEGRGPAERAPDRPVDDRDEARVPGAPTNHAMTRAEVLAQIDDGAVQADGRLANTVYLDQVQEEEAQRRRERVERGPEASKAAALLRERASQTGLGRPAEDLARSPEPAPPVRFEDPLANRVLPDTAHKTQLGDEEREAAQDAGKK